MEGVILFADDHIFDEQRLENKLFQKFNSDGSFSILPINNLTILEKTVVSISTYKALILDWNFDRKLDDEDGSEEIRIPYDTPFTFLKDNTIYSLVYIYSQADIPENEKKELEKLYPGKIFFEKKDSANEPDIEYKKIIDGIKKFEDENKHLALPYVWSQAINQSAQVIFSELEQADPNWIKEIYNTAKNDGAEPNTEVIGVFQHLLSEQIIQNTTLLSSISSNVELPEINITNKEESSAKLYHRIYYTKVESSAPLMTGDVFMLDADTAAILITPECDIEQKCKLGLDFLLVKKSSFSEYLTKALSFTIGNNPSSKQSEKIEKLFNQEEIRIHVLPSFPFELNQFKTSALIDFQSGFIKLKRDEIIDADKNYKSRNYKLNSPYIHQLRQRYLAYIGRVGVPAIPQSLRLFNLK